MRVYRISSQAKINLNLNVIKKSQSKGIHLIETLVCFIKLSDKISIDKKIGSIINKKMTEHPIIIEIEVFNFIL